jgi:hypothetical protein
LDLNRDEPVVDMQPRDTKGLEPKSEKFLHQVGIVTPEDLKAMGAVCLGWRFVTGVGARSVGKIERIKIILIG